MNSQRLVSVILTSLVLALVAGVEAVFPAPASKYTIRIERLGVVFDLPRGFSVLQHDIHGGPATIISVGKELRPGHLMSAPLQLVFWPTGFDGTKAIPEHTPSQYVDAEFKRVKEGIRQQLPGFDWEPEYVKLFGNKAVRYTVAGLDIETVILGYLRAEQLPVALRPFAEEYLVRIAFSRDVSVAEFERLYKSLIDTVVNSLRAGR